MQRSKRERSCKPKAFVNENSEDYINLTNEMMFKFLDENRNVQMRLVHGKIQLEHVKDSIVRCFMGYPIDTPDNKKIEFEVDFILNRKGECPFGIQESNILWAKSHVIYTAYFALDVDSSDYVIELKALDKKLKTFSIHNVYRSENCSLPKKKFRTLSDKELLDLEMEAEVKRRAEQLFRENDQSIREEAINKLALEFKEEAKREYESALAENRRLLMLQIEEERQRRFQELALEIEERINLARMSEATAEIPK